MTGSTDLGCKAATDVMAQLRTPPGVPAVSFDIAIVVPRWCDAIYASEFEGRKDPFNEEALGIKDPIWSVWVWTSSVDGNNKCGCD